MLYLDIETNGLNPSTIWCVVVNDEVFYGKDEFNAYMDQRKGQTIVAHNAIRFDVPVLERLWGFNSGAFVVLDTLVLSRLGNPNRTGGHSLSSFGDLLGFAKGDHEDWSCLSDEMVEYCKRDVKLLKRVHKYLEKELEGFSQESIDLEHDVARIIFQQETNGFLLDTEKATLLVAQFKERMLDIEADFQKQFPPIITERYSEKTGKRLKDNVEVFNVGSRQQIAKRLETVGAVWTKKTEKGHIIVDEVTLEEQTIPEAKLVLEYLLLQKRKAQVSSWLEAVNELDGRVHGKVNSNGAVTGRMTHNSPNMAQVPSVNAPFGADCRGCWIVPKGYSLVGADASGLELRMLAHYMNDQEYTNELLNGDIHTRNQQAAGLPNRNAAKTFIYAFLYGAGDEKIGSIVGEGRATGKRLKEKFLSNVKSLGELRERVTKAAEKEYLSGLDGRRLAIRSEHAALNTLLQGAGAIVMKKALTILDKHAILWGIDYKFVANIHDEWQAEVRSDQASKFGWLAVESIKAAGIQLGLRCPLDGEYKVGNNWAETH